MGFNDGAFATTGWTDQTPTGFTDRLYDVHFTSVTTGTAVGASGIVLQTTDRGVTWIPSTVGGPSYTWYGVHMIDANTIYVAGDSSGTSGYVYVTTNGGSTWAQDYTTTTPPSFRDISFYNAFYGGAGGVLGSGNKNISYHIPAGWGGDVLAGTASSSNIYGIDYPSSATVYSVGNYTDETYEGLYKSADSGATWPTNLHSTANKDIYAVDALSKTRVWFVGQDNTILRTTDGGSNIDLKNSGASGNFRGVHFYDTDNGWVVGQGGAIYRTTNGADADPSWTSQSGASTLDLEAVHAVDANNAWIVGGGSAFIGKWVVDPTITTIEVDGRPDRPLNYTGVMTIEGANFQSTATVAATGMNISISSITSTTMTGTATLTATGAQTITVYNPDTGIGPGTFTVNPLPAITSANPSTMTQGTSGDVIITGTGFQSGITTSDVVFSLSGITVNSVTVNSQYQITANVAVSGSAATGTGNITVTNPDTGAGAGSGVFSVTPTGVTPPTITSLSPNTGTQGAASLDVTITGTNFRQGPPAPTVVFGNGGITVNSVTWNSSTSLTANITILATAETKYRTVTVTNDNGGIGSSSNAFLVQTPGVVNPVISSILSGSGYAGGTNYFISGTGFQAGATVSFYPAGNITINSITFVSSAGLRIDMAISSEALVGKYDLTVTNTDGGSDTLSRGFEVKTQTADAQIEQQRGLAFPNPWSGGPLTLQWQQTKTADVTLVAIRADGLKLYESAVISGSPGYNKLTLTENDFFAAQHLLANQMMLFMIRSEGKVIGKIKVMVVR